MHDPQYYLLWGKQIHEFTSKENPDSEDGKQTERRKLQSAVEDHWSRF